MNTKSIFVNQLQMQRVPETFISRSRTLRKRQSDAEKFLWHKLRNRAFHGFRFKRQCVVGHYIVDFYCPKTHLVIELDGGQHNQTEQKEYDQQRTKYLKYRGLKVIRFWNHHVFKETEAVMQVIWSALHAPHPHP